VPYRSPARYLAPLALIAAFFAVYTVVKPSSDEASDEPASTQTTTTTAKKQASSPKRRSYTVKSGDVLSAIAESTGVPLERLLELNPDLDPQTLRSGQKIKLTR
jgi:LysM repeat protein